MSFDINLVLTRHVLSPASSPAGFGSEPHKFKWDRKGDEEDA